MPLLIQRCDAAPGLSALAQCYACIIASTMPALVSQLWVVITGAFCARCIYWCKYEISDWVTTNCRFWQEGHSSLTRDLTSVEVRVTAIIRSE